MKNTLDYYIPPHYQIGEGSWRGSNPAPEGLIHPTLSKGQTNYKFNPRIAYFELDDSSNGRDSAWVHIANSPQVFTKAGLDTALLPTGHSISSVVSARLPKNVTGVGDSAFSACTNLQYLILPDELETFGDNAFEECTSLKEIQTRDSVDCIGQAEMMDCTSLVSVTLPNGLTTIGDDTFSGCIGLTSIELPNNITTIGQRAFKGCTKITEIQLPDSVKSIAACTFSDCTSLEYLSVGVNCDDVAADCIDSCSSLRLVIANNEAAYNHFRQILNKREGDPFLLASEDHQQSIDKKLAKTSQNYKPAEVSLNEKIRLYRMRHMRKSLSQPVGKIRKMGGTQYNSILNQILGFVILDGPEKLIINQLEVKDVIKLHLVSRMAAQKGFLGIMVESVPRSNNTDPTTKAAKCTAS